MTTPLSHVHLIPSEAPMSQHCKRIRIELSPTRLNNDPTLQAEFHDNVKLRHLRTLQLANWTLCDNAKTMTSPTYLAEPIRYSPAMTLNDELSWRCRHFSGNSPQKHKTTVISQRTQSRRGIQTRTMPLGPLTSMSSAQIPSLLQITVHDDRKQRNYLILYARL